MHFLWAKVLYEPVIVLQSLRPSVSQGCDRYSNIAQQFSFQQKMSKMNVLLCYIADFLDIFCLPVFLSGCLFVFFLMFELLRSYWQIALCSYYSTASMLDYLLLSM